MLAGPRQDRFESLDVLRGVAVLGIFAVNILAMAQPPAYFANPALNTEYFNADGQYLWSIMATFFQFKFITIFSALFGAGVILMVGEEKPSPKFGLHYRRMLWLMVFGALHGFVIWYGDILLPYAISGMIIVFARRWRPRTLFIVAAVLLALFPVLMMVQDFFISSMTPEQLEKAMAGMGHKSPEEIQAEIAAYQGAFPGRISETLGMAIKFEAIQGLAMMPRHIGVMLSGMALFKLGFFTLRWSFLTYLISGLITLAIGYLGSSYSTEQSIAVNFEMIKMLPAQAALMVGSLFQSFGYAALIMAICRIPFLSILRLPFASAGRMALSNYLLCSFIGVFLYYGPPGLGRIGSVSFPEMAQTVVIIWIAMLVWSPIWLAFFRFGPFEWLWRSLSYWRLQPLTK